MERARVAGIFKAVLLRWAVPAMLALTMSASVVIPASATPSHLARLAATRDPRGEIVSSIEVALNAESSAASHFADVSRSLANNVVSRKVFEEATAGGKAIDFARNLLADADKDVKTYEGQYEALPVAERPEGALSEAQEITTLTGRAYRYDELIASAVKRFLSSSSSGKELQLVHAIESDMAAAKSQKQMALSIAEKLPALPVGSVNCKIAFISGNGQGVAASGSLNEDCTAPVGFDTVIVTAAGHSFSPSNHDPNTVQSCSPDGAGVSCKLKSVYQQSGGRFWFGWTFAATDSAQAKGSCGLAYEIKFALGDKTVSITQGQADTTGQAGCSQ